MQCMGCAMKTETVAACCGVATPGPTRACARVKLAGARVKLMQKTKVNDHELQFVGLPLLKLLCTPSALAAGKKRPEFSSNTTLKCMKMLLEPFPIAKYDFSEKKFRAMRGFRSLRSSRYCVRKCTGVRAHTVPGQLSHPGYATGCMYINTAFNSYSYMAIRA